MKNSRTVKFLASAKLLIALLIIIACASAIGTIVPQGEPAQTYIERYGEPLFKILENMSLLDMYRSWWFTSLLVILSLNILACTLTRFPPRRKSIGTVTVHLSVIVILAGATIGAIFGNKGFMKIYEGESQDTFYMRDDKPVKLGFTVHLDDFNIDWYEPPHVVIFAQLHDGSVKTFKFKGFGEEMAVKEIDSSIKLLRYVPDFSIDTATHEVISKTEEPNNPAVEIVFKGPGQESKLWLFERFPGFGQENIPVKLIYRQAQGRARDYKSALRIIDEGRDILKKTIEVNHPLTYKGYAFYQSSYDPQDSSWSGLQVAKDPGIPVVYTGFALLIAGLSFIYFVKPYLK